MGRLEAGGRGQDGGSRGIVIPWRRRHLYDERYNANPYAWSALLELMTQDDITDGAPVIGDMPRGEQDCSSTATRDGRSEVDRRVVGRHTSQARRRAREAGFAEPTCALTTPSGGSVPARVGGGRSSAAKGSRGVD